jgi:hypothetical protein
MGTHRHRQRPRALFYYPDAIQAPGHPFYRKNMGATRKTSRGSSAR